MLFTIDTTPSTTAMMGMTVVQKGGGWKEEEGERERGSRATRREGDLARGGGVDAEDVISSNTDLFVPPPPISEVITTTNNAVHSPSPKIQSPGGLKTTNTLVAGTKSPLFRKVPSKSFIDVNNNRNCTVVQKDDNQDDERRDDHDNDLVVVRRQQTQQQLRQRSHSSQSHVRKNHHLHHPSQNNKNPSFFDDDNTAVSSPPVSTKNSNDNRVFAPSSIYYDVQSSKKLIKTNHERNHVRNYDHQNRSHQLQPYCMEKEHSLDHHNANSNKNKNNDSNDSVNTTAMAASDVSDNHYHHKYHPQQIAFNNSNGNNGNNGNKNSSSKVIDPIELKRWQSIVPDEKTAVAGPDGNTDAVTSGRGTDNLSTSSSTIRVVDGLTTKSAGDIEAVSDESGIFNDFMDFEDLSTAAAAPTYNNNINKKNKNGMHGIAIVSQQTPSPLPATTKATALATHQHQTLFSTRGVADASSVKVSAVAMTKTSLLNTSCDDVAVTDETAAHRSDDSPTKIIRTVTNKALFIDSEGTYSKNKHFGSSNKQKHNFSSSVSLPSGGNKTPNNSKKKNKLADVSTKNDTLGSDRLQRHRRYNNNDTDGSDYNRHLIRVDGSNKQKKKCSGDATSVDDHVDDENVHDDGPNFIVTTTTAVGGRQLLDSKAALSMHTPKLLPAAASHTKHNDKLSDLMIVPGHDVVVGKRPPFEMDFCYVPDAGVASSSPSSHQPTGDSYIVNTNTGTRNRSAATTSHEPYHDNSERHHNNERHQQQKQQKPLEPNNIKSGDDAVDKLVTQILKLHPNQTMQLHKFLPSILLSSPSATSPAATSPAVAMPAATKGIHQKQQSLQATKEVAINDEGYKDTHSNSKFAKSNVGALVIGSTANDPTSNSPNNSKESNENSHKDKLHDCGIIDVLVAGLETPPMMKSRGWSEQKQHNLQEQQPIIYIDQIERVEADQHYKGQMEQEDANAINDQDTGFPLVQMHRQKNDTSSNACTTTESMIPQVGNFEGEGAPSHHNDTSTSHHKGAGSESGTDLPLPAITKIKEAARDTITDVSKDQPFISQFGVNADSIGDQIDFANTIPAVTAAPITTTKPEGWIEMDPPDYQSPSGNFDNEVEATTRRRPSDNHDCLDGSIHKISSKNSTATRGTINSVVNVYSNLDVCSKLDEHGKDKEVEGNETSGENENRMAPLASNLTQIESNAAPLSTLKKDQDNILLYEHKHGTKNDVTDSTKKGAQGSTGNYNTVIQSDQALLEHRTNLPATNEEPSTGSCIKESKEHASDETTKNDLEPYEMGLSKLSSWKSEKNYQDVDDLQFLPILPIVTAHSIIDDQMSTSRFIKPAGIRESRVNATISTGHHPQEERQIHDREQRGFLNGPHDHHAYERSVSAMQRPTIVKVVGIPVNDAQLEGQMNSSQNKSVGLCPEQGSIAESALTEIGSHDAILQVKGAEGGGEGKRAETSSNISVEHNGSDHDWKIMYNKEIETTSVISKRATVGQPENTASSATVEKLHSPGQAVHNGTEPGGANGCSELVSTLSSSSSTNAPVSTNIISAKDQRQEATPARKSRRTYANKSKARQEVSMNSDVGSKTVPVPHWTCHTNANISPLVSTQQESHEDIQLTRSVLTIAKKNAAKKNAQSGQAVRTDQESTHTNEKEIVSSGVEAIPVPVVKTDPLFQAIMDASSRSNSRYPLNAVIGYEERALTTSNRSTDVEGKTTVTIDPTEALLHDSTEASRSKDKGGVGQVKVDSESLTSHGSLPQLAALVSSKECLKQEKPSPHARSESNCDHDSNVTALLDKNQCPSGEKKVELLLSAEATTTIPTTSTTTQTPTNVKPVASRVVKNGNSNMTSSIASPALTQTTERKLFLSHNNDSKSQPLSKRQESVSGDIRNINKQHSHSSSTGSCSNKSKNKITVNRKASNVDGASVDQTSADDDTQTTFSYRTAPLPSNRYDRLESLLWIAPQPKWSTPKYDQKWNCSSGITPDSAIIIPDFTPSLKCKEAQKQDPRCESSICMPTLPTQIATNVDQIRSIPAKIHGTIQGMTEDQHIFSSAEKRSQYKQQEPVQPPSETKHLIPYNHPLPDNCMETLPSFLLLCNPSNPNNGECMDAIEVIWQQQNIQSSEE